MRTSLIGVGTSCRGSNHSDHGTIVECGQCGRMAVKRDNGSLAEVRRRNGEPSGFYCWVNHDCDERDIELHTVVVAERIVAGEPARGALVKVVKGRKVPVGTVGIVRVVTKGEWGTRVALAVEGTEGLVWTAATNVVVDPEVIAEAQATVDAWKAVRAEQAAAIEALEAEAAALVEVQEGHIERITALPEDERRAAFDAIADDLNTGLDRRVEITNAINEIKRERGY